MINVIAENVLKKTSETSPSSFMFDGVSETVETGTNMYRENIKPKNHTIEAATVYIELPENEVYVLVYFKWQKPKAFWNDGFTIWGLDGIELLEGKLFYQKDSINYEAPYQGLEMIL